MNWKSMDFEFLEMPMLPDWLLCCVEKLEKIVGQDKAVDSQGVFYIKLSLFGLMLSLKLVISVTVYVPD